MLRNKGVMGRRLILLSLRIRGVFHTERAPQKNLTKLSGFLQNDCVFVPLSLWERAARQQRADARGEGRRSLQILRPSPYPLPEGEGESSGPLIVRTYTSTCTCCPPPPRLMPLTGVTSA